MSLTFIGKDPDSGTKSCPSAWVDEAGDILVQGWNPSPEEIAACLATGPIPGSETVVKVPARMAGLIREACELAEQRAGLG
ncbi:hypothetical protein [Yinghuangia sp. YIM S09857]|uniref:hypothetical protein n=1 Tax=Yinghuangia sp. YIM S09857 TaxID=3436929 RepID=UPI003F52A7FF